MSTEENEIVEKIEAVAEVTEVSEPEEKPITGVNQKIIDRINRRSSIFRRNKEMEPIMEQYIEQLAPKTKRELQLVKRIVSLQLQINHDINVDTSKRIAARLIKRVVGK